jgi:hypothetical protein
MKLYCLFKIFDCPYEGYIDFWGVFDDFDEAQKLADSGNKEIHSIHKIYWKVIEYELNALDDKAGLH